MSAVIGDQVDLEQFCEKITDVDSVHSGDSKDPVDQPSSHGGEQSIFAAKTSIDENLTGRNTEVSAKRLTFKIKVDSLDRGLPTYEL
jgi:hypothetical protein